MKRRDTAQEEKEKPGKIASMKKVTAAVFLVLFLLALTLLVILKLFYLFKWN